VFSPTVNLYKLNFVSDEVVLLGLFPPDHQIYKEGWSIAIRPPTEKEKPRSRPKKPQDKK